MCDRWQELITWDCLGNMIQMSMRIKCFADEQNFIKEKQSLYFQNDINTSVTRGHNCNTVLMIISSLKMTM